MGWRTGTVYQESGEGAEQRAEPENRQRLLDVRRMVQIINIVRKMLKDFGGIKK